MAAREFDIPGYGACVAADTDRQFQVLGDMLMTDEQEGAPPTFIPARAMTSFQRYVQ